MAIRQHFDPDLRILFATAEGTISFADIQEHLDEEENGGMLSHRELVDASTASTDMTDDQVRILVRRVYEMTRKGPFGPTAIAARDDTLFGMARMLAILCDIQGGPQVAVFRNVHDGLEWLVRHSGA